MRSITTIAITLLAFVPLAGAAPAAQSGQQDGMFWSEGTLVSVQGGTNYLLAGAVGDHDIFFFNAAGQLVGSGLACGADRGAVPRTAVQAWIRVWDHTGGAVPQCLASGALPTGSTWVYVDGF